MRLGAGAYSVGLFIIGIAAYAAFQAPPVAECREIATDLNEAQSDVVPFDVTWSIPDVVACVFAPESKRDSWLTAIQVYQSDAAQLQDSMQTKP